MMRIMTARRDTITTLTKEEESGGKELTRRNPRLLY
jgi:hypothetical protein